MNALSILAAMLKADLLERSRRSSFLVTLCLVIYLGYAVNAGQVLIHLGAYRGIYNSAWVGGLMALVITFFLGLFGFYLVKNAIARDERSGVGQIIATTSLTRRQYVLGKWLSNFAVLAGMVGILALAAILMQMIQREDPQLQLWPLLAPFLLIALPMMAFVAACAVLFETVSWLRGGFGNLVYFFLFFLLFFVAVQFPQAPWLDVAGITVIGSSMKAAVSAVDPSYSGGFVLTMASSRELATFVWPGLRWSLALILQRLLWVAVAMGVALLGSLFFDRFDPAGRSLPRGRRARRPSADGVPAEEAPNLSAAGAGDVRLAPLAGKPGFHANPLRLAWLECLLLVKGLKWYWLAGMAVIWIGSAATPSEDIRRYWFMLAAIWPVLVWSKMGQREACYGAEQLIYQGPHPLARLLLPAWLAGVVVTSVAASGVLLGRLIFGEPAAWLPWALSVLFIPTLALTLGVWSRSSKLFEVVYPILWYLGPFNTQNTLSVLDYLGIHAQAPVNTAPLWMSGFITLLLSLALLGRRRHLTQ